MTALDKSAYEILERLLQRIKDQSVRIKAVSIDCDERGCAKEGRYYYVRGRGIVVKIELDDLQIPEEGMPDDVPLALPVTL